MVANEMAYKQLVARFRPIKLTKWKQKGETSSNLASSNMIANSVQVTHWL